MREPLVDGYWQKLLRESLLVRRLARRLVRDSHEAEDLVQDTWLAAVRRPPRSHDQVARWLAHVTRNLAAFRARSQERRLWRERDAAQVRDTSGFLDASEAGDSTEELRAFVLTLAEPYRSAIHLRFYENLSAKEVARRQGVPVETARTHIKRGLVMLRRKANGRRNPPARALLPLLAEWRTELCSDRGSFDAAPGVGMPSIACAVLLVVLVSILIWSGAPGSADPIVVAADMPSDAASIQPLGSDGRETSLLDGREPIVSPPQVGSIPGDGKRVQVSGRVLDREGRPAAGATVRFLAQDERKPIRNPDEGVLGETQTDVSGQFQFSGLPPRFSATASLREQVTPDSVFVFAKRDLEVRGMELQLDHRRSLRGRLTDESGRPLEGQDVRAFLASNRDGCRPSEHSAVTRLFRIHRATTDEDGRFLLPDLPCSPVNLEISSNCLGEVTRRIDADAREIEFELPLGHSLTVSSRIPTQETDLEVSLFVAGWPRPRSPCESPSPGTWRFEGLPNGGWVLLKISGERIAPRIIGPFAIERRTDPMLVDLESGRELSGIVLANGRGFAGVEVATRSTIDAARLFDLGFFPNAVRALRELNRCTTDETGRFTLTEVARADLLLEIRPPGEQSPIRRERISPETGEVEIRLDEPAPDSVVLNGVVREASTGRGLSSVTIDALPRGGTLAGHRVEGRLLGADGRFEVRLTTSEVWSLVVGSEGFAPAVFHALDLAPGRKRLDFDLHRSCQARLRLLDRRGVPLSTAKVSIRDVSQVPVLVPVGPNELQSRVQVGQDGSLFLHDLPAMPLELRVSLPELGYSNVLEFDASIAPSTALQDLILEDLDLGVGRRLVDVDLRMTSASAREGPDATAPFEGDCRIQVHDTENRLCASWAGRFAPTSDGAIALPVDLVLILEPSSRPRIVYLRDPVPNSLSRSLPESARQSSSVRLGLPPGPCRVTVDVPGMPTRTVTWNPDSSDVASPSTLRIDLAR